MRRLWRMTLWGATAASTLLIAVLTTRSEVGSQRVAVMLSSLNVGPLSQARMQTAARPLDDAQGEIRRLAESVRSLMTDDAAIRSRVAAIEHNMDDLTGSVARQIESAKAPTPASWPTEATPPVPAVPAIVAPGVAAADVAVTPLPELTAIIPPPPASTTASATSGAPPPPAADPPPPPAAEQAYGVDIGSAVSIQTLRARWLGIRSAHPQLFHGLTPAVTLRGFPHSNRIELRLVVGPFANAETAAQLCTALAAYRLACQPTSFDRQHLALQ